MSSDLLMPQIDERELQEFLADAAAVEQLETPVTPVVDYLANAAKAVQRIEAEATLARAALKAREIMAQGTTPTVSAAQLALANSLEYPTNTKGLGL